MSHANVMRTRFKCEGLANFVRDDGGGQVFQVVSFRVMYVASGGR